MHVRPLSQAVQREKGALLLSLPIHKRAGDKSLQAFPAYPNEPYCFPLLS